MSDEKFGFLDYTQGNVLLEKKKKKKSKKKKKRKGGLDNGWYTNGTPGGSSGISVGTGGMSGAGAGGGVGESLIYEIFAGITPAAFSANMNSVTAYSQNDMGEETGLSTLPPEDQPAEEEVEVNAVDNARQIFQRMKNEPNITRAEILNAFMDDVGVTESTATSYYTRFLKEFGMTSDDIGGGDPAGGAGGGGMGNDEMEQGEPTPYGEPEPLEDDDELEEPEDPKRAGLIRVVDDAHLIYKKQSENGTYEELWIYNTRNNTNDELKIRRDILAGTDIPPKKTKSPDGVQSYTSTTMGNAQMLEIKGLPN